MSELRKRAHSLAAAGTEAERAHWMLIDGDFTRWLERKELPTPSPALKPPPGDRSERVGSCYCWFCEGGGACGGSGSAATLFLNSA
jgi:hypothetical protein